MTPKMLRLCNIRKSLAWGAWIAACLFLLAAGARAENSSRPFRFGLPQSIFHTQHLLVADWQQYLQGKLRRPVEFVSSRKFSDSIVQLHAARLDFAWVTDYPSLRHGLPVRLLVAPLYKGKPFFTSYLIVPASDTQTTTLMQLRGKVMVFADPTSNSHIEHRYLLLKAGEDPKRFFRKVFFTHSHRESIDAVILGLADAVEVDNFVWDAMAKGRPELTLQTRTVARSQEYGAPPMVANHFISNEEFDNMQGVLIGMAHDPEGVKLLKRMNLDGFAPAQARFYEPLLQMRKALGEE
ncbi:MAG: PhnD/SsuA/transferrin family substrate-binding protein [Sulfuritalea sp.]|nr:PhnD/SsuA/transferrin family substrate-binding protein [Sulfuritalea sp.]